MTYQHIELPLSETIARAGQLSDHLKVHLGQPGDAGWVAPTELFAPASERLATLISAARQRLRTSAGNTIGSALLQGYQWPIIATSIACYLLDRRVPDLTISNVRLHPLDDGEMDEIALLQPAFTALPNDPAAANADVRVVADRAALRTELRSHIEAHLGVVIACLCDQIGCNPRGLWLNVADRCAGTLIWLMQALDSGVRAEQIEHEMNSLIRVPGSPLNNKMVGLFTVTHAGHTRAFLDRATCCYWYKTDGGDYCNTCPHRTTADRNERLRKYMAEEYAAG